MINLSVDIGIVVNPFKHPDLVIRKLCDDEVTFWIAAGNRNIQDIHSKQAVIVCDPDLTQTQSLLKESKNKGFVFERFITTNSLEVVANLTAAGSGIGILPARVANSMYPNQLKRLQNLPVFFDEVCLIYRNENREVQAIQTIIEAIKNEF